MIVLDVVQGSPEWEQARIGIPTASAFDKLLTPAKLEVSKSAPEYRNRLLAEWLLGHPIDWGGASGFMDRGREMEPEARAWYELQHDVEAQIVGFVLRADGRVGGSPDSLIGLDGGLEIKCPAINTHIGYLLSSDSLGAAYRGQVQGYMYITGRAWWDLMAYHPQLPPVVLRIERDETYIKALDKALSVFLADLDAAKATLAPHRMVKDAAPSGPQVIRDADDGHARAPEAREKADGALAGVGEGSTEGAAVAADDA